MKTTFSALKVWLLVGVVIAAFGCAKKDDGNNNNSYGNPYGYPYGNPGGTTGGTVGPGGLIASAAGLVNIPGDCGGNQNIDFELYIRAGAGGGTQAALAGGQIRMAQSDCLCGISVNPGQVLNIIDAQSPVTISGSGNYQTISGNLTVQGGYGIFNIAIQQARIEARSGGPAIGRISNTQFPYMLTGSVQPGTCRTPSMMTDWSFDPL